jgi:methyl-accepting chemotaxis protein
VVTEIVDALRIMQKTTGDDMKEAMQRVHSMTASITRATNEQKASTLQINTAVEHIRDLAIHTQNATTQQLEGVQQVLEVANDVRALTDQNVQSSQHIDQTASDLNGQAQLLLHSVDRFKLLSNGALVERRRTEAIRQADTTDLVETTEE